MAISEEQYLQDQASAVDRLRQAGSKEDRQAVLDEMRKSDLLKGVDLSKTDLRGAILHAANLSESVLNGANLRHVILSLSNLIGTDLRRADLRDADLFLAKLSDANLSDANLRGASLCTTLLVGADLSRVNLKRADLHEADLSYTCLDGARLEKANLYLANLEGAKFVKCKQLRQARRLEKATLPDGTKLPGRTREDIKADKPEPPWREAFEEWCKTVPVDENGFILPEDND